MGRVRADRKPRANNRYFQGIKRGGGETRGGSSPTFGTIHECIKPTGIRLWALFFAAPPAQ
jgi:hypothetical protein